MSVKIYDGLRARNQADPFAVGAEIRGVLEPLFFGAFREHLGAIPPVGRGVRDLFEKMDELKRSPIHTFDDRDIFYEVTLLPNAAGGTPLVMVFSEDSRYRQALLDAGVVDDYGYWDNADQKEGVSDEEWAERERAWSAVFDNAPNHVGLHFSSPSLFETSLAVRSSD